MRVDVAHLTDRTFVQGSNAGFERVLPRNGVIFYLDSLTPMAHG